MVQILTYTIPALLVMLAAWLVLYKTMKNEDNKRQWELKRASQKEINATRMRAYERLSLLLERTQPEHMLLDMQLQGMTVMQVQQQLLRTIRLEYDHNLSQQIYVSDELWDKIIRSRDEMAAFVNTMAIQMPQDGTSLDYAKVLMTGYNTNGDTPTALALAALKAEVRQLF